MQDHDKIEDASGMGDLGDLGKLGSRISALSRPAPSANLAAKTVAYVQANCPPKKRSSVLFQSITNPAARVAAAAVIVLLLSPLTDLETAASLGSRIEQRLSPQVMNKLEAFMDPVLPTSGENYSDPYFDSFLGFDRPAAPRKVVAKPNRRV